MAAAGFIQIDAPWYFGEISREKANELLVCQPVGTYLIRQSNSRPGFVFTVKETSVVKRYLILYDKSKEKFCFWDNLYDSLEDFLDYYSKNKTFSSGQLKAAPKPVYLALYNYSAQVDSDLSFSRGDQLHFIYQKDKWVLCQSEDERRGWAPLDYMALYSAKLADKLTGRNDRSSLSYCQMSDLIQLPASAKVIRNREASIFLRNHLSIRVGEALQIQKFLSNGFCQAWRKADGASGIVPLNYIQIDCHVSKSPSD